MRYRAVIRHAQSGSWLAFTRPVDVLIASCPEDVCAVLDAVAAHCSGGGWAAGYLTFEAASGLDRAFSRPLPAGTALAEFGLFSGPCRSTSAPAIAGGGSNCERPRWRLSESFPRYEEKLATIHDAIGRGDVYQVNYTMRFHGCRVHPGLLFDRAARTAPCGAWLERDGAAIVSASPELFFRLDDTVILSSPMKGTAARRPDAQEDLAQRRWLAASAKNRAENLMITDMVRNDLGRIAEVGTVRTHDLFRIHALPTVWQMTSTVAARTRASLTDIFRALFPAASITGAPKIAAWELIRELEDSPRGIYTGAIGYVGPGRSGLRAQFNVAIRTARIRSDSGDALYGVGGGIVWDSQPEEEYAEARLKARVLEAGC